MYVGMKLVEVEDESRVMCVLTYADLMIIEAMLVNVGYGQAAPLVQAVVSLADRQQKAGLADVVQEVVDRWREALKLASEDADAIGTVPPPDETRH